MLNVTFLKENKALGLNWRRESGSLKLPGEEKTSSFGRLVFSSRIGHITLIARRFTLFQHDVTGMPR